MVYCGGPANTHCPQHVNGRQHNSVQETKRPPGLRLVIAASVCCSDTGRPSVGAKLGTGLGRHRVDPMNAVMGSI